MNEGIAYILRQRIPGCVSVVRANKGDDRAGTDYWAERDNGLPRLSIDVKVRAEDFLATRGKDDLALETWSVIRDKRVGWTRDANKRTDYVLWFWQDTGRFFLVSFPALCKVFSLYWQQWRDKYGAFRQASDSWESECIFVPRTIVREKLDAWQSGQCPQKEVA